VHCSASKGSSVLHKQSVNTEVGMEGECHSPVLPAAVADLGHLCSLVNVGLPQEKTSHIMSHHMTTHQNVVKTSRLADFLVHTCTKSTIR
jgi:hypothetical protein